jgi:2-oxoglutarate ferredoxin oxidoreductase subunit delta
LIKCKFKIPLDEELFEGSLMPDSKTIKKKHIIRLNESFCKGCGYCIEFCPRHVFEGTEEINDRGVSPPKVTHPEDCTGCELCASLCPDLAISIKEEEA